MPFATTHTPCATPIWIEKPPLATEAKLDVKARQPDGPSESYFTLVRGIHAGFSQYSSFFLVFFFVRLGV